MNSRALTTNSARPLLGLWIAVERSLQSEVD